MRNRGTWIGMTALAFFVASAIGSGPDALPVRSLAFSSDGGLLAAGAGEPEGRGTVVVWELPSGKVRFSHDEAKGIPSIAFAPDDKILAFGSFSEHAKLIAVADGKVVGELAGHGKAARCVAFSPDAKSLAVGSYDGFINVWDTQARQVRRKLTGHEGWVYNVAFFPDGGSLISASADQTFRVWNLTDGKETANYRHGSLAKRAFVTKDARTFATVGWTSAGQRTRTSWPSTAMGRLIFVARHPR